METIIHCMVDLETLGTTSDSVILSAGFVFFTKQEVVETKEFFLDLNGQHRKGFKVDPRTLTWWLEDSNRSKNLKKIFAKCNVERTQLEDIFAYMREWLSTELQFTIWANSPSFDLSMLRHHATVEGFPGVPWSYFSERDLRTIKNLAPKKPTSEKKAHNALYDAIEQTEHLLAVNKFLKGALLG